MEKSRNLSSEILRHGCAALQDDNGADSPEKGRMQCATTDLSATKKEGALLPPLSRSTTYVLRHFAVVIAMSAVGIV